MAQHTIDVIHRSSDLIREVSEKVRTIQDNVIDRCQKSEIPLRKISSIQELNGAIAELYRSYNLITKANRDLMALTAKKNRVKRLQMLMTDILSSIHDTVSQIQNLIRDLETKLMSGEDR
jgi:uncharacterized coiled-coil protein SlyX